MNATHSGRKLLLPLILFTVAARLGAAVPLGSAFTYQGRLQDGGGYATGLYEFQASLWDAPAGGNRVGDTNVMAAVPVTNGLFVLSVDFGVGAFNGSARWLNLLVRSNGAAGAPAVLSPRTAVAPAPQALFAVNAVTASTAISAGTAALVGPNAVKTPGIVDGAVTAAKIGNGEVVKSLNGLRDGVSLSAGANIVITPNGNGLVVSGSQDWKLDGNAGNAPGQFVGTRDPQPLVMKVNNTTGLRLEFSGGVPNIVGGHASNSVVGIGGVIGGGGLVNSPNQVTDSLGFVGGGVGNTAGNLAVVGGGQQNLATGLHAAVAGGGWNTASGVSSFVGGGGGDTFGGPWPNTARGDWSAILGGWNGLASGYSSAIGGGAKNVASGSYSVVPGGTENVAAGNFSLAAGRSANANHQGSFVWADSAGVSFSSTTTNEFSVRAGGGVRLQSPSVSVIGRSITVKGAGDEQAFMGGDGVGGDVEVGSLNASVNTVTLWNRGTGSEMDLTTRDAAIKGAPRAPGAGINTPTFAFLARKTNSFPGFDHVLLIDNPLINENPNVFLFVQHNYGGDSRLDPKPVGVYLYGVPGGIRRWGIYHEDLSPLPLGSTYNVMVVKP